MSPVAFGQRVVQSGGLALHCVTAGPPDGKMVLCLHGFPACWATWRATMAALASAGYFVVAPDLRGAGESDRPPALEHYAITHFVEDVAAIVDAFGRKSVHLVGHDFGGGVAWATAMFQPQLIDRLAILNSVHPVGFERQMRHWSQVKKSWYVFFFQLPALPEWWLARNDYGFVRESLAADGLPAEVIEELLAGVRPAGALHAMLQWYRASFRDGASGRFKPQKVDLPTLIVWGDRETHLDAALADPPADWVTNVRVEHVPEASHWVHHDAPARVAELLRGHFAARTEASA